MLQYTTLEAATEKQADLQAFFKGKNFKEPPFVYLNTKVNHLKNPKSHSQSELLQPHLVYQAVKKGKTLKKMIPVNKFSGRQLLINNYFYAHQ